MGGNACTSSARSSENRILLEADPDYLRTLKADRNENRRKAWLEGSWDIVAGGLFDDLWMPQVHVVQPFHDSQELACRSVLRLGVLQTLFGRLVGGE